MTFAKKAFVVFIVLLLVQGAVFSQTGRISGELIDELSRSVVQIIALDGDEPFGTGTGTIVSADGVIYTNRHVTERADDYAILMLEDLNELPVLRYYARIEAVYDDMDVAVLHIDRDEDGDTINTGRLALPFIDLEAATDLRVSRGEEVYIFGYPGVADGYLSFTSGTITTIQNGDVGGERLPVLYQTDAEIAPGNSGGLAVTSEGIPVGIPTEVQVEEQTGGRLGGILPFGTVIAMVESGDVVAYDPGTGRGRNTFIGAADEFWTCDENDAEISNGTSVTIIQMRPGFSYTATVIGIGEFDPVLMVVYPDDSALCSDDSEAAQEYNVTLPGVGTVEGTEFSSQVVFPQNTGDLSNMKLVVGGYGGQGGEFILLIEGMGVSSADGLGDPFAVLLNRSLIGSGVPLSVFMVGRDAPLNPYMGVVDLETEWEVFLRDDSNDEIVCDDAGTDLCWGGSFDLSSAELALGSTVVSGDAGDAMLSVSPADLYNDSSYNFAGFIMSSLRYASNGQYILAFHMGLAEGN